MSVFATTADTHFVLLGADGVTQIPLILTRAVDKDSQELLPAEFAEALSAAVADSPLADWLEPVNQRTWRGGCGIPEIGYASAAGCDTRFADIENGYVIPGPAPNTLTVPATNNSATPLVAMQTYSGFDWVAQMGDGTANTARVFRATSGSTTFTDSHLVPDVDNEITDLMIFEGGSGGQYLWASGNDATGGRMHEFNGSSWSSTASNDFGVNRRDWLAKVYWKTEDGIGAWRMVAGNGFNRISYTRPDGDPMDPLAWIEGVPIETSGRFYHAAVARRHLYLPGLDGIFDLDELGNTPNLAPFMEKQVHPLNGYASFVSEGWLYYSTGWGLSRIWVGDPGMVAEQPGECSPGAFTAAEHSYGGWCTAITGDQGWLVAAFYNPYTQRSAIWWGRDRKYYSDIDSPNPLIWHGPIIHSNADLLITVLHIRHDPVTNRQLHLFVGSIEYDDTSIPPFGTANPDFTYFTLPFLGSSLNDVLTFGQHHVASGTAGGNWQPTSRLISLPRDWQDKSATKIGYRAALSTQGLHAATGTKLQLLVRADPTPGSTTWGTASDITVDPTTVVTESPETSGYALQDRVDFFAPSGTATPPKIPILLGLRRTAWRVVEDLTVYQLDVEQGDMTASLSNGTDQTMSPTRWKSLLRDVTRAGRTVLRLPNNTRVVCKLRQVLDGGVTLTGGEHHQQRARARLVIAILDDEVVA